MINVSGIQVTIICILLQMILILLLSFTDDAEKENRQVFIKIVLLIETAIILALSWHLYFCS